jgi:hypothetical protein
MNFSQREYEALLRNYLPAFLNRAFVQLNPGIPYLPNPHIDVMADRLQKVLDGEIKRLIINVPPRSSAACRRRARCASATRSHSPITWRRNAAR